MRFFSGDADILILQRASDLDFLSSSVTPYAVNLNLRLKAQTNFCLYTARMSEDDLRTNSFISNLHPISRNHIKKEFFFEMLS